ncbi:MAG: 4Fe-4S dicluster domain-containing protein [Lentimicrobiaceae bacterium]|nr:4Fe-4S dicluster domain-containing protein [Lentimicrobiaceae bacterium]
MLYEQLEQDVRFQEGMKACMNCGTCTAICPAAEFYDYDPRKVLDLVQQKKEAELEALLKSDVIWFCGECMSCITRCPRNNAPGLVIMALRTLSQQTGLFVHSIKGRQQLLLKRTIGSNILNYGYCVYAPTMKPEAHPEAGPVWEWEHSHLREMFDRLHGNLDKRGPGALRKIPDEDLAELKSIFDITGTTELFEDIERYSAQQAKEMGMDMDEYVRGVEASKL